MFKTIESNGKEVVIAYTGGEPQETQPPRDAGRVQMKQPVQLRPPIVQQNRNRSNGRIKFRCF